MEKGTESTSQQVHSRPSFNSFLNCFLSIPFRTTRLRIARPRECHGDLRCQDDDPEFNRNIFDIPPDPVNPSLSFSEQNRAERNDWNCVPVTQKGPDKGSLIKLRISMRERREASRTTCSACECTNGAGMLNQEAQ